MTAPVAFVDTETLGLDADHQPVWEVGLILPGGTERVWQVEVTPRQIDLAHPIALEIGRFHERYGIERSPDRPEHVARDLSALIPKDCHLAGAVVSFDEERLRRLLWAHGYAVPWHYHLIDVEALAAGHIAGSWAACNELRTGCENHHGDGPDAAEFEVAIPPWDSHALSAACGVDPDDFDKHTALGDARWARAIYQAVMGA